MKMKEFLKLIFKRYFILGLNGMALGLFATLITGLIIKQIGLLIGGDIGLIFSKIGTFASICTGAGIGIGVAKSLNCSDLIIYASSVTGFFGSYAPQIFEGKIFNESQILLGGAGDPVTAFLAVIFGIELGRLVHKKTVVDIIITPLVTIISGCILGLIVAPFASYIIGIISNFIEIATNFQPFLMGIIISIVMGILLTLPVSSAAIAIILGLSGIAGGAATVGCCAQMVGFAVMSFRENGLNGLFAQGLGTSMIQISNIIKKPIIWLPPIITSAILGPVSTVVLKMENIPTGAGMGTSGLVGQISTWQAMYNGENGASLIIKILLLHFILPAIITLIISEFMRSKNLIKLNDLKLNL